MTSLNVLNRRMDNAIQNIDLYEVALRKMTSVMDKIASVRDGRKIQCHYHAVELLPTEFIKDTSYFGNVKVKGVVDDKKHFVYQAQKYSEVLPHYHEQGELIFLLEGEIVVEIYDREQGKPLRRINLDAVKNNMLFIKPGIGNDIQVKEDSLFITTYKDDEPDNQESMAIEVREILSKFSNDSSVMFIETEIQDQKPIIVGYNGDFSKIGLSGEELIGKSIFDYIKLTPKDVMELVLKVQTVGYAVKKAQFVDNEGNSHSLLGFMYMAGENRVEEYFIKI